MQQQSAEASARPAFTRRTFTQGRVFHTLAANCVHALPISALHFFLSSSSPMGLNNPTGTRPSFLDGDFHLPGFAESVAKSGFRWNFGDGCDYLQCKVPSVQVTPMIP